MGNKRTAWLRLNETALCALAAGRDLNAGLGVCKAAPVRADSARAALEGLRGAVSVEYRARNRGRGIHGHSGRYGAVLQGMNK